MKALEDDTLLVIIQQALAKRCKKSKTRGRKGTRAEVVLRDAAVEACSRLELRSAIAGSARQSGLSRVHPDRRRQGQGRPNDGKPSAPIWGTGGIVTLHFRMVLIASGYRTRIYGVGSKLRVSSALLSSRPLREFRALPNHKTAFHPGLLTNSNRLRPLTCPWGIVPEQLGHRLLQVPVILVGVLTEVQCLGRGAAPHQLLAGGIE